MNMLEWKLYTGADGIEQDPSFLPEHFCVRYTKREPDVMIFKPSPKQVLALWNMLFTGEEPAISKIQPGLNPRERGQLQEAGLIEIEKRGRASHIILTEKAWAWAAKGSPSRCTNASAPCSVQTTGARTRSLIVASTGSGCCCDSSVGE